MQTDFILLFVVDVDALHLHVVVCRADLDVVDGMVLLLSEHSPLIDLVRRLDFRVDVVAPPAPPLCRDDEARVHLVERHAHFTPNVFAVLVALDHSSQQLKLVNVGLRAVVHFRVEVADGKR